MRLDLGLPDELRSEIAQNLNIVINSAATLSFEEDMDVAIRVNTTGALQLLKLAEESPNIVAFCQVSTNSANCDRTGYVEEKVYDSGIDWQLQYDKLVKMGKGDLFAKQKEILGAFPNPYCYTKRMTEHLLQSNNEQGIPIVILRPSVVGAALSEPMPGWTDTTKFLGGITLTVGLGIGKSMPCKEDALINIVPVDMVARQILVSVPYLIKNHKESNGKEDVFITSCSSSSLNPIKFRDFFDYMTEY